MHLHRIPPTPLPLVELNTFDRLSKKLPLDFLLPKLRYLKWDDAAAPLRYLPLFLGSSHIYLDIDMKCSSHAEQTAAFAFIHSDKLIPNLETLVIHGIHQEERLSTKSLPTLIHNLGGLREVEVSHIDKDALNALADLPVLQRLRVYADSDSSQLSLSLDDIPPLETETSEMHFKCLEDVDIAVDSLDVATAFIQFARSPVYKSIRVDVNDDPKQKSMSPLKPFSAMLREYCNEELLHSFHLSWRDLESHVLYKKSAIPTIIKPLLKFKNMRNFELGCPSLLNAVDDALLMRIAEAWPCLEKFILYSDINSRTSKATINGLRAFIACPRLVTLQMPIDATCDEKDFIIHTLPRRPDSYHAGLRYLDLQNSSLPDEEYRDPYPLAATLSDLFPYLTTFLSDEDMYCGSGDEFGSHWLVVDQLYWWFIRARKQARGLPERENGESNVEGGVE